MVPPDVKVSHLLWVIEPLHAKWIVDLYHQLKTDKEMIINGFRAPEISETIENAQDITKKVENPLRFFQFFNISFSKLKQKI